jgi:hypothetical protein
VRIDGRLLADAFENRRYPVIASAWNQFEQSVFSRLGLRIAAARYDFS